MLISEYQEEQKELQIKIDKLEQEIKKAPKTEDALLKLREVALKYINEIEITQEMVNDLVSKIILGYTNKDENGKRQREITIIYKFIEMSLD